MSSIRQLCTRAVMLDAGRVLVLASHDEVAPALGASRLDLGTALETLGGGACVKSCQEYLAQTVAEHEWLRGFVIVPAALPSFFPAALARSVLDVGRALRLMREEEAEYGSSWLASSGGFGSGRDSGCSCI
jgi:hypothetical protein